MHEYPLRPLRCRGFTLIELVVMSLTVVLVVLFLILGVGRHKLEVLKRNCLKNLKQVGLAYRTWPRDSADDFPQHRPVSYEGSREWLMAGQLSLHFDTMSNELSTTTVLVCPADKEKHVAKSFGAGFSNSNISYFASLDAADEYPDSFLSGDRNLALGGRQMGSGSTILLTNAPLPLEWTKALHKSCGNIGFGDGSVFELDQKMLTRAILKQGINTNRLVFP